MDRYINLEAYLKKLYFEINKSGKYTDYECGLDDAYAYANDMELANVEPARHARWVPVTNAIHCDNEAWVQYQCSDCGRVIWVDHNAESLSDYPYCHCGAKMDEEENEK